MVEPVTISILVAGVKQAYSFYQQSEAKDAGLTPEQLKLRIDAADRIIKSNIQIVERISQEIEKQKKEIKVQALESKARHSKLKKIITIQLLIMSLLSGSIIWLAVKLPNL